ncbi:hypothetical protein PLESTB_001079900 [Pleodorina starrii]|uniref:Uncharacterized protein n=1 Tax=Pleodorina starrii TaxID=330485 RepID=A0A9W6BQF9_9CHLO|nr:hypothetical protein PLESTB_001079900 [Pleodorina starrii]GLC69159.1 hypothetical protein PLESTF_000796300 [Pleodorina starrii]
MTVVSVQDLLRRQLTGEDPETGSIGRAESPSEVLKGLVTRAKDALARGEVAQTRCLVTHKYDNEPVPCAFTLLDPGDNDVPVHEIRFKLGEQNQLLVVNRKGAVLHASSELVNSLKDVGANLGIVRGQQQTTGGGMGMTGQGAGGVGAASGASAAAATGLSQGVPCADHLSAYTLCDFLPSPWKEMHVRHLKDGPVLGPTLELRTAAGKPLYMHVSVSTADVAGELNHVIRMSKSSLESALTERRLRLQLSVEGVVTAVTGGNPTTLFGLESSKVVGRAFWEVLDWSSLVSNGKLPADGRQMFFALVRREVTAPGHSWRMDVLPASKLGPSAGLPELVAIARTATTRPAILQMQVEMRLGNDDPSPDRISVELWPTLNASGLLEVDSVGRVRSVLEERTRPAGLLFGVASPTLVGMQLADLVTMPQGRNKPGDLLSHHAIIKSSLKSSSPDLAVKVATSFRAWSRQSGASGQQLQGGSRQNLV